MTTMTTTYQLLGTVREGTKFRIKTIHFSIKYVPGVPAVAGAAPGRTNRPPSLKIRKKI